MNRRAGPIRVLCACTGFFLLLAGTGCRESLKTANDAEAGECPEGTLRSGNDCLMPCPAGWSRDADNRCRPPCLEEEALIDGECMRPCPEGTTKEGNICTPEGASDFSVCPADLYNDEGVTGDRLYIHQSVGTEDGDGSRTAPFATVKQAIDALEAMAAPEIAVLVGAGEYDISDLRLTLSDEKTKISIIGKCHLETIFVAAPESEGFYVQSSGTDFVFKGLNFQSGLRQIIVNEAASITVDSCAFSDWAGDKALLVMESNSFVVRNTSFAVFGVQDTSALSIQSENVEIESCHFSVVTDAGQSLFAAIPRTLSFIGNRVEGSGMVGAMFFLDERTEELVIRQNLFDGDWVDAALYVVGDAEAQATVTIESNSLENHTSLTETGSKALKLERVAQVSIIDLRVEQGNVDAIFVSNLGNLTITDSTLRNVMSSGLVVEDNAGGSFGSCIISVSRCHFIGMEGYAVFHKDAYCDLSLVDNVLENNRQGVWAAARSFEARDNDIGANDGIAIQLTDAKFAYLGGNTIASVDSFGIDLFGLQGETTTQYVIENNGFFECKGIGVSLRHMGEGEVLFSNNAIAGTRGTTYSNQDGEPGTVGDGVSIVSYANQTKTRVKMEGNAIGPNARLGVIVEGQGSIVDISKTSFEDGNGYGALLPGKESLPCNLMVQNGATISGADQTRAIEVSGLFVVRDISSAENED